MQQDLQKLKELNYDPLGTLLPTDYREKLNKSLEDLVLETEAYRNALFEQTYLWFFQ
ncbi:MAG: hypothetical protein K0M45_11225 [Candidatus Paracaedibacteraceae bacterium]|nr:hypothetical protein [Candidatus Paracaedibacteraceae bacterium]